METSVKLIAMTAPVETWAGNFPPRRYGAQDLVVYCARVSNPKNQEHFDTGPKLLKYLIDHEHWSPFEMVNLVFEVKTSRDISRQILRHQLKFQEFSQRYAEVEQEWIYREARLQDPKNRQNSIEIDDNVLQHEWDRKQKKVIETAWESYRWALNMGIAKEQARTVLPEGLTLSTLYINGYLRNWIHYTQLRMKKGTQKEHRMIATEVHNILVKEFPALEGLI